MRRLIHRNRPNRPHISSDTKNVKEHSRQTTRQCANQRRNRPTKCPENTAANPKTRSEPTKPSSPAGERLSTDYNNHPQEEICKKTDPNCSPQDSFVQRPLGAGKLPGARRRRNFCHALGVAVLFAANRRPGSCRGMPLQRFAGAAPESVADECNFLQRSRRPRRSRITTRNNSGSTGHAFTSMK